MAIANTIILHKKSTVSGNTPASLANGEIAINNADGKLFYRTSSGGIGSIVQAQSFATVNANSSLILAGSPSDTLSIVPGNNITITANTTSKTITINSTSSGGGGSVTLSDSITSNSSANAATSNAVYIAVGTALAYAIALG